MKMLQDRPPSAPLLEDFLNIDYWQYGFLSIYIKLVFL